MAVGLSARLLPEREVVAPGERLIYNVLNTGSMPIAFGKPHRLERLEDDGWRAMPVERGLRSRPLFTAHPGHARQLKLKIPRRMEAGRYRLTLEVRDYARRTEPRILGGLRPDGPVAKESISFEFEVNE